MVCAGMIRSLPILAVLLALTTAASGCGGGDPEAAGTKTLSVVATTQPVASLVEGVGGERIRVTTLLPANADPHDYEIRPQDVESLAQADVIVRAGGELDHFVEEAVEASGTEAKAIALIDSVRTREGGDELEEEGQAGEQEKEEHAGGREGVDPHWWHDPRNAIRAVDAIARVLVEADADGAGAYERRSQAYAGRVGALDSAIERCWSAVPTRSRKLVTTHDAFGYYADRYDLDVVGTVIPSLSTQGQPSSGAVDRLVDDIRAAGVKAIFTESAVSPRVEQAIADEAGARLAPPLYADTVPDGARGDGDGYLATLRENTQAMIDGLAPGTPCSLPR